MNKKGSKCCPKQTPRESKELRRIQSRSAQIGLVNRVLDQGKLSQSFWHRVSRASFLRLCSAAPGRNYREQLHQIYDIQVRSRLVRAEARRVGTSFRKAWNKLRLFRETETWDPYKFIPRQAWGRNKMRTLWPRLYSQPAHLILRGHQSNFNRRISIQTINGKNRALTQ